MSQKTKITRRNLIAGATGTAAALAMPAVVRAATETIKWRMVTSWPKRLPGPGMSAERIAETITALSGGRLEIKVYSAGELVPALQVFDGVAGGAAEMGHTASFFWQGKMPAAPFFTAVPFGLTPLEHHAWIYHGGGQALWDEIYGAFGVKPFMAGNTGMSMGGWYLKEIKSTEDIKGLKVRMPGLGGEIFRIMGATPVSMPPGEIASALQSGVLDGTEFLGPWSDLAMGFYKVTPIYHWPGFHEPNGTGEALIGKPAWEALPDDLKQLVETVCRAEASYALAETTQNNAIALGALVNKHKVQVIPYPADVIAAGRELGGDVMLRFADSDGITRRIYESYAKAQERSAAWSRVSTEAFLKARNY